MRKFKTALALILTFAMLLSCVGGVGAAAGRENELGTQLNLLYFSSKVLFAIAGNFIHEYLEMFIIKELKSEKTIKNRLALLKKDGFIVRVGSKTSGYWEVIGKMEE